MASELLDLATTIALEAADLVVARRRAGVAVAATKSSDVDVVTEADRASELLIRERIAATRPGDAFFGEEGGASGGTSGLTWVVDPIDGTVNYLYGIPQYAVSIAVVEGDVDPTRWRILAGALVNPATGALATAALGAGAHLDGRALRLPEQAPPLAQSLVATGFSYAAENRLEQIALLADVIGEVRDIRRQGAAALDLVGVAAGTIDGYYESFLNPWDIAAGTLVVTEAGGVVEHVETDGPLGRMLVAGHADTVRALTDLTLASLARRA